MSTNITRPRSRQDVDLQIRVDVYADAMEKLEEVRAEERATLGAARTTLADVGRQAVLMWRPLAYREYTPTPRSPNGERPKRRPFRFKVARQAYAEASKRIQDAGTSVTAVVEEALRRFALTGRS